jgi:lysophospholipase L1-like esterase
LTEIAADADRTLNPLRGSGLNVAVVWAGTNDLAGHHETPQQIFSVLRQFSRNERRLGFKIFVMTMISRVEDDQDKNPYNAMIRAFCSDFADGLIDVAANPALGANGAYKNPEYFQDGIHLTDKGYALVGSIVQATIEQSASGFEAYPKPDRQLYAQSPIAR